MALSSYFLCKVSLCRGTAAVLLLGLCSVPVFAKSPELSAIELYTIADSRVFVGVAGFTLNAKNEVHLCSGARTISKGNYGKLPRVELAAGMSLERTNDGVLLLNRGGAPECVVPGNLKLERAGGETPSELADKAVLSGQVVSKSVNATSSIPPFARGVKIVLVAMLDTELAEFLLAQRGGDIVSWRGYLVDNPAGPHASEAKAALSILYGKDGQTALAAYQSSVNARQPNYAKLEAAKSALDYALATAVSDASTDALAQAIGQEAKSLDKEGLGEIALYQTAVAKQSTGYSHLLAAEAFLHITLNLDQKLPETISLSEACTKERTILDHRFVDFANKLSANRPDEAFEAIKPLRPFAQEFPKVQNSLDALYSYYVGLGKKDAEKGDLQGEVSEFRKAAEVKPTPEVGPMIEAAEAQAHESADRAAATTASSMSAAAEDDNDFVKAYEVLANLTPSQRKLVAERLDSLKDRYVAAALLQARDLQRTHIPIKGIGDERGVQHAYNLLKSCYLLTNDPDLQDRITYLGESLGASYLAQAKHYLDRPEGTGANVGWNYLVEASQYKGSNAEDVRDEMTRANGVHQLRSRLSISAKFRDSTSRREAVNFADQLTDSLASGLESSGLKIKVVRPNEAPVVQASFALVGDVLQNTESNSVEKIAKTSKYRTGNVQIPNEDWNKANREYESATLALQTAQQSLGGATARGKKNQISDAKRQVDEAQKKVELAHIKLDSLPKTLVQEIEYPYTYIEQINRLKATVELRFVILDTSGNAMVPMLPILETQEKAYTTLENVKSEDTMGVREEGEVPSGVQFLEQIEYGARDRLLKESHDKVVSLPALILQSADRKAAEGDNDGAAEHYMLYLGSTDSQGTPERRRAQKFLLDNYNFQAYGESSPKA